MTDIVERLRARSFRLATSDFNAHGAKLAFEAADEIEKLRAALKPFAGITTQDFAGAKDSDWTRCAVKIGDLRAAAAALKEMGDE